jgi:hypothetical protein
LERPLRLGEALHPLEVFVGLHIHQSSRFEQLQYSPALVVVMLKQ